MTNKEKRELKDGVISIFKRFNILDHTATIGGLRDDILRYINSLQEESVSEDLEEAAKHNTFKYVFDKNVKETLISELKYIGDNSFKDGAKWQKQQDQSTIELVKVSENETR